MSNSTTALSSETYREHFDHSSPELSSCFWGTMKAMRAECPVAHSDVYGGYWIVTRYEDVLRVVHDWHTFTSADGVSHPPLMPIRTIPLEIDPPMQRLYRQLLNPYMTPKRLEYLTSGTRRVLDRLIDSFIESGTCDFAADLAVPFPGMALFEEMLGLESDSLSDLHHWLDTFIYRFGSPDAPAAFASFQGWIAQFVADRRTGPHRDDPIDGLLHQRVNGKLLTDDEITRCLIVFLTGGLETTTSATCNIALHLATDRRDLQNHLRDNPSNIPAAVEEFLRLEAPAVAMGRRATRDVELGGRQIKAGDWVVVYYGSANHDESEFPNGDQFDLHRSNKQRHLSFGAGVHRCVGSNLARLNLRLALGKIVTRLPELTLATQDPIPYRQSLSRTAITLPVRFRAGERSGAR
jgi:cytochrome P450